MIKIIVEKKEDKISRLTITGHALFENRGKDIVCAGVSAVAIGGINAIHEFGLIDYCDYTVEEGRVDMLIKDCLHMELQVILETLHIQLKTIEESYFEYISIQEV
ncbi:ribosomal-processing cysteine protease Prp [Beduini massiliensis]|uniref:ribosomal-processing cysteine protease Prp n=1 Tax=Beduini massiliensis TaxID=1585974 RepID=UPI00059A803E|nr:ribosomal-processing cysteine protease Prp [Beduini massiliensis]